MAGKVPDFQAYQGEGEPRFANDVELECAKLLDYYGVPWAYEPRTFVLEEDEAGLQRADEHGLEPVVVARDLASQLGDARPHLGGAEVDGADAFVERYEARPRP